jgi:hypothetical protein
VETSGVGSTTAAAIVVVGAVERSGKIFSAASSAWTNARSVVGEVTAEAWSLSETLGRSIGSLAAALSAGADAGADDGDGASGATGVRRSGAGAATRSLRSSCGGADTGGWAASLGRGAGRVVDAARFRGALAISPESS